MQSCGAGGALHWETALQDEPKDEPCFIVFLFAFFLEEKKKKGRKKKKKKQGERDMSLASEFAWSLIQEEGRQRRTHMFIPSDSNKEPIVGSTCLRKSALCS